MSASPEPLLIGLAEGPVHLLPKLANRHGLIAGATGTGKTVTLQVLAEQFSRIGVPVFMADVKGDLSGMSQAGAPHPKLEERAAQLGLAPLAWEDNPVIFWDVFGEQGHPLRTTISEMGPLLLSRLMDLSEAQEGVLNIAFRIADEEGLLLLDLKDLRAMLGFVADNAEEIRKEFGLVTSQSVGAIQRGLLVLEEQGGDLFFGEPALELSDLMRTRHDGRGYVSILAADRLLRSPRLYATMLLWLLSELFDEAHLLFTDAPKALVEKVEQVVRLIRSKGVGVYFVTQNPLDVPDTVLSQLGNRVQHALRAFTPRDQKAVRSAADTFRPNPAFSAAEAITELGVGEALVSCLEGKGAPGIVQRTFIRPPLSRLGPATEAERQAVLSSSPVASQYSKAIDRESAYELLTSKAEAAAKEAEEAAARAEAEKQKAAEEKEQARAAREEERARAPRPRRETPLEAGMKSVVRSAGSQIGRQLVRGILGSLFKGR
jgi:DNA helicase HerA-like ATPase